MNIRNIGSGKLKKLDSIFLKTRTESKKQSFVRFITLRDADNFCLRFSQVPKIAKTPAQSTVFNKTPGGMRSNF